MRPLELYRQAEALGLRLEARGDKLAVFPGDRCPADFAEQLRQHKQELLPWLSSPPCPGWQAVPPVDLPLNPTRPRPQPADARRVMVYVMRQIGDPPGPLCAWCVRREDAYWQTCHWPPDVCAYAAVRDAACWQLSRAEHEVWAFLHAAEQAPAAVGAA